MIASNHVRLIQCKNVTGYDHVSAQKAKNCTAVIISIYLTENNENQSRVTKFQQHLTELRSCDTQTSLQDPSSLPLV